MSYGRLKRNAYSQVTGLLCVPEVRHATYVHDQHRSDYGVRYCCWRRVMMGADRIIRWSTTGTVVAMAAVARLARVAGPACCGPLCGLSALPGARDPVPGAARVLLESFHKLLATWSWRVPRFASSRPADESMPLTAGTGLCSHSPAQERRFGPASTSGCLRVHICVAANCLSGRCAEPASPDRAPDHSTSG
jgi:hypothetical protein